MLYKLKADFVLHNKMSKKISYFFILIIWKERMDGRK